MFWKRRVLIFLSRGMGDKIDRELEARYGFQQLNADCFRNTDYYVLLFGRTEPTGA